MEAIIESLIALLRANSALAAWAGTDALGAARVYWGEAPPLNEMNAAPGNAVRYVVIHGIPGPGPDWTFSRERIETTMLQIDVVALNEPDGKRECAEGWELVRRALEPPQSGQLEAVGVYSESPSPSPEPALRTLRIMRRSSIRGPYQEERDGWRAHSDWEILTSSID